MTLHPSPSEFPYIWGKFCFLFYQCRAKFQVQVRCRNRNKLIAGGGASTYCRVKILYCVGVPIVPAGFPPAVTWPYVPALLRSKLQNYSSTWGERNIKPEKIGVVLTGPVPGTGVAHHSQVNCSGVPTVPAGCLQAVTWPYVPSVPALLRSKLQNYSSTCRRWNIKPEKIGVVLTAPVPGTGVAEGPLPGEGPVCALLHLVRVRAWYVIVHAHSCRQRACMYTVQWARKVNAARKVYAATLG
jgi:hypothetical protein